MPPRLLPADFLPLIILFSSRAMLIIAAAMLIDARRRFDVMLRCRLRQRHCCRCCRVLMPTFSDYFLMPR